MLTGDAAVNAGGADHRLHRRGAGQHRAARGCRRRHRPGRDGRVPLLRRPRPRLGLAGAAAGAAEGAVPADVGHPRRRHVPARGPHPPHRPADRAGRQRRAPGSAAPLLRDHADARDDRRPARHQAGAGLRRPLHPGLGAGAGAGADERQREHQGGEGGDRRPDRRRSGSPRRSARRCRGWSGTGSACTTPGCCPSTGGWWNSWPRPACSRSSAAPTPSASASTCRSGPSSSRRCRSTTAPAPGCSAPASSTRSPAGPGGPATTPRAPSSSRRPTTRWRTSSSSPRSPTTRRSAESWCAARCPRAWCRGASRP